MGFYPTTAATTVEEWNWRLANPYEVDEVVTLQGSSLNPWLVYGSSKGLSR